MESFSQGVSNNFPGFQVRAFCAWNWECLSARWNSQPKSTWFHIKQSNTITAEGVRSDPSVSLLSAQGRITADGLWQAKPFCGCAYQSSTKKCSPSLQRKRDFNYSCEKSIFSCNSTFQTFLTPHECETKASWRFSPRESMLSLTLPDQVQHGVQPGLNQGCKFKPVYNMAWVPGCHGVELLRIYVIYKHSNILLQPGLDPKGVCDVDCCGLGQLLVHLHLYPAWGQFQNKLNILQFDN